MNSTDLYKLKNDTKCVFLNENTINSIMDCFAKSNIKTLKNVKKQVNVMKTNKVQAKKNLNENKMIMIMNKISDNNINELIVEYINNILIDTEDKYIAIQIELFNKMIHDITFINNYIIFAMKVFCIEKQRLQLIPNMFINMIKETLSSDVESDRIACYSIIKGLIKVNFFNDSIITHISNNILTIMNPMRYIDTYYWFNKLDCIDKYKTGIYNIISKCELNSMNREKILIESILTHVVIPNAVVHDIQTTDVFITSVQNILDEYIFLKSIEEVIDFISTDCVNIYHKNIFCKEIISHYMNNNNNELFTLIDTLIRSKVLFKSNVSKGLLLYLDESSNILDELQAVEILKFLKIHNITKNIEHLFKKYKVKLHYDN